MARTRFTKLQGQYLAFIHSYERVHREPPAEADLQKFFGVTPPAIHDMVVRIHRAGLVSRVAGRARTLRVLLDDDEIPPLAARRKRSNP